MKRALLFSIIFCLSLPVLAQQRESTSPKIGGHRFILNGYVNDPFIYSGFKMHLGAGLSEEYDLLEIPIGDTTINLRGGFNLYTSLNAGYRQKINDWAMIYFSFGVLGRLGTQTTSLLANGVNSITGSTYGMKFKIFENEKSVLSADFDVKNYNISVINVLQYIADIIDNNPRASLTQNSNSLFGTIGASYAYAINDLLGVYGTARYSFGDSVLPGKKVSDINFGLAIDIDLMARTKIPLGASLGLTSATIPEITLDTSTNTTLTNFRLVYNGRDDLQIGLNMGFFTAPFEIETRGRVFTATTRVAEFGLTLNYFF